MVGIDFGTTYCSYAFMFTSDPTSIYTAMGEERESTCVLLNPDKTFNAFGKQALDMYTELEPEEHQSHYFFHHFKMKMYESKKLTRETSILDQTGKEMKAMDVYGIVLQHFNSRVMQHVGQVKSDEINQEMPANPLDAVNTRHMDRFCQAVHARSSNICRT